MRQGKARHVSRCKGCHDRICVGDRIGWSPAGWMHLGCAELRAGLDDGSALREQLYLNLEAQWALEDDERSTR